MHSEVGMCRSYARHQFSCRKKRCSYTTWRAPQPSIGLIVVNTETVYRSELEKLQTGQKQLTENGFHAQYADVFQAVVEQFAACLRLNANEVAKPTHNMMRRVPIALKDPIIYMYIYV